MTDRELMQMALDTLDLVTDLTSYDDEVYEAIDALRARLTQPEPEGKYSDIISDGGLDPRNKFDVVLSQEPVAWMRSDKGHIDFHKHPDYIPLYTAPPQRDFKFSTIDEAKQPMSMPAGRPQLTDDESRFADAFTALIKAGYGKEAEIVLKCKPAWQGLTDEDWIIGKRSADYIAGAEWAEAKLKEKNNG